MFFNSRFSRGVKPQRFSLWVFFALPTIECLIQADLELVVVDREMPIDKLIAGGHRIFQTGRTVKQNDFLIFGDSA